MIGTSFGPYRIESLIGRGGMGEVYRALDTGQDGRRVALKVLGAGMSDDPQFAARFRREAEIAARLSDPHVVPIHRYGEIGGRLFLDMQLVDGRELAAVLGAEGALSPARALAVLEQVGGALDAAHADGLVHRDVKPSNILLTGAGTGRPEFAYLLDFGIARATDQNSRTALTRTGAVIGTLSYMAPERFLAQRAGPPSDVYSLTCVLHEMLTGARPYPGSGYAAQVAGHLQQPPPRPSVLRPGLPPALDAVVATGMAKEPAARYRTAGDLVGAAVTALGSGGAVGPIGPVPAPPTLVDGPAAPTWVPPPVPPLPPWNPGRPSARPRGRRWWMPVAGAAALVVAVLATILLVDRPSPPVDVTEPPPAAAAPAEALPSGGPITERTLVGRAPDFSRPTVADFDGTPVLVVMTGSEAVALDIATGEPIGVPVGGVFAGLTAAATRLDGHSVMITGGADNVIRLWDIATGEPLATTLTGHSGVVKALDVVQVDGRKVLLSAGDDQTVRRWDLATATPIGEPLPAAGAVDSISVTWVAGRPVVLAKGFTGPIQSWDVATGTPLGPAIPAVYNSITAVELPEGPSVLSHPDYLAFQVVAMASGAPVPGYAPGRATTPITAALVDGRPLLVDTDRGDIRIRDLRTGLPVGGPLTGHESTVSALMPLAVGDTTFLVSTSMDRSIRIWDLTARARG